jgi:nucleoside-diphosphate-sugar epimerase
MKIVLTGASGYLGSNLMLSLSNFHNVLSLSLRSNTVDSFEDKLLKFNPDAIIHCGWGLGNSHNDISDIKQIDNISLGCKLLESISKLDNVIFMGFGSFSEYGIINTPVRESGEELPVNLYGLSKNSFRFISQDFCRMVGNRWVWIRPCYIYGKNDVSTRLIPKVFNSCLNKNDIVLNSSSSVVDYLYIDDFCSAIKHLLESDFSGVYNICSGKEYRVSDVIHKIQDITGVYNTITYDQSLDRDTSYSYICGDNQKLRDTGWTSFYDMTSGLSETLTYYSSLGCGIV